MNITSFLHGMYYAGQLPSRAEYRDIAKYLRKNGLANGKQLEVEKQVAEAIADLHRTLFPEENKPKQQEEHLFTEKIVEGVKYLDKDLGESWPERIDLKEFDMPCGRRGIIGQLYGHFSDRFDCEAGVPYGFDLYLTDDSRKYKQLKQEWKEKIIQLKQERALA